MACVGAGGGTMVSSHRPGFAGGLLGGNTVVMSPIGLERLDGEGVTAGGACFKRLVRLLPLLLAGVWRLGGRDT